MAASKNGRQVITVGSLADLEVIETEIEIERPDGNLLRVPVRSLTPTEIAEERAKVRWPTPPEKLVGKTLVPNVDDPAYQAALNKANQEAGVRILVRCLKGGGVAFPGETDEEHMAAAQERLGAWAVIALSMALSSLNGFSIPELRSALGKLEPADD